MRACSLKPVMFVVDSSACSLFSLLATAASKQLFEANVVSRLAIIS